MLLFNKNMKNLDATRIAEKKIRQEVSSVVLLTYSKVQQATTDLFFSVLQFTPWHHSTFALANINCRLSRPGRSTERAVADVEFTDR
jgi:hypothetical protein